MGFLKHQWSLEERLAAQDSQLREVEQRLEALQGTTEELHAALGMSAEEVTAYLDDSMHLPLEPVRALHEERAAFLARLEGKVPPGREKGLPPIAPHWIPVR